MYYDIFDYLETDEQQNVLKKHETMSSKTRSNRKTPADSSYISPFPKNTPLAMAYVPYQNWSEPYEAAKGLEEGTLFEDLNFKFERGV